VANIRVAASSATGQHPSRHEEQGENHDDHKNTDQPVRHGDHLTFTLRRTLIPA
jgi:hypothetical protein